ncbi:hypothetical protein WANA31_0857, partial [Wolbachia endosymbiont of Drosophila ananassae]
MQYTRKLFRKSIVLSFTRTRKLPFSTVFSMILKLVKKSLGIECELMEPLTCDLTQKKWRESLECFSQRE